jgi:hypothetical protein
MVRRSALQHCRNMGVLVHRDLISSRGVPPHSNFHAYKVTNRFPQSYIDSLTPRAALIASAALLGDDLVIIGVYRTSSRSRLEHRYQVPRSAHQSALTRVLPCALGEAAVRLRGIKILDSHEKFLSASRRMSSGKHNTAPRNARTRGASKLLHFFALLELGACLPHTGPKLPRLALGRMEMTLTDQTVKCAPGMYSRPRQSVPPPQDGPDIAARP